MNAIFALLSLTLISLSSAQFFYHQQAALSPTYQLSSPHNLQQLHYGAATAPAAASITYPSNQYAHPSVIANAVRDSQLPPELLKSDRFFKNPKTAAALAKDSWFTDKEMPVLDREAEKIPREMVYKIFKNAGYIKRR